jgi:hypothetical protein
MLKVDGHAAPTALPPADGNFTDKLYVWPGHREALAALFWVVVNVTLLSVIGLL